MTNTIRHFPHTLHPVSTPEDIYREHEAHLRAYLRHRAAGLSPIQAGKTTIIQSYPRWRIHRAAHVASVFADYAGHKSPTLATERDLVAILLIWLSMNNHPGLPGSPLRNMTSREVLDLMNDHWRDLLRPLPGSTPTLSARVRIALQRIACAGNDLTDYVSPTSLYSWVKNLTNKAICVRRP